MAEDVPARLHPFAARLSEIVGPDLDRVLESLRRPKRVGCWINPMREDATTAARTELRRVGCELEPLVALERVYTVPSGQRDLLTRSSVVASGVGYVTNPSSVLVARLVQAQPGDEVLDLAAAPGGKTLQMAAAMENRGRIAAVEPVKNRFFRMRHVLELGGAGIVRCYRADGRSIGSKVPERFDRVLLDAPCSSEARIRLADDRTHAHWSLRKVAECARKQRLLLRSAFDALAPGGHLIYATCSFAPEENELIIAELLHDDPRAEVLPMPEIAGAVPARLRRPGLTCWHGRAMDAQLDRALRILPDETWDGFFACRIGKRAKAPAS